MRCYHQIPCGESPPSLSSVFSGKESDSQGLNQRLSELRVLKLQTDHSPMYSQDSERGISHICTTRTIKVLKQRNRLLIIAALNKETIYRGIQGGSFESYCPGPCLPVYRFCFDRVLFPTQHDEPCQSFLIIQIGGKKRMLNMC